MGSDWIWVCNDSVNEADQTAVKSLAGLNPNHEAQRRKVRKILGLTFGTIIDFEADHGNVYNGTPALEKSASDEEDDGEDDGEGDEQQNEGGGIPLAFKELDTNARVLIYQRWVFLGRPLLSPPLVTSKKQIYTDLNTLVCHVSIRPYTFC
jgi:hypothetical protein